MSLTQVVLRLSRNPDAGFPGGDDHRGYTIHAPLNSEGKLDVDLWRKDPKSCTVDRFSPDEDERADGAEKPGN